MVNLYSKEKLEFFMQRVLRVLLEIVLQNKLILEYFSCENPGEKSHSFLTKKMLIYIFNKNKTK